MDVVDALHRRVELRDYTNEPVEADIVRAILDAARVAPSGHNSQHWRFILVDDADTLETLAEVSTTGTWIADAAFAVVVLTDPAYAYHHLDAGRAITHMQLAGWADGVGSCIYTGYDENAMRSLLDIPDAYAISAVVGFGYPPFDPDRLRGRKNRRALHAVAFDGRFGTPLDRFNDT